MQYKNKKSYARKSRLLVSSFPRFFSLAMLFMLSACSLFKECPTPPIYLQEVNFSLDSDANKKSATAIDLVIVYDPALLEVLLKMEAKDYYVATKQLKQDYPTLADILHWELTPGQVVKNYPITLRSDAPQGVVMFADYYAPGPHRVRVGSSKIIHIHFRENDFCILEQGCFGEPNPHMSQEAVAMKKNIIFKEIEGADPKATIAQVEAVKSAQAQKDGTDLAKEVAKQAEKFSAKY